MEIHVENLKCSGCANTVHHALQKIKGVENVIVDVENELVKIKGHPDRDIIVRELDRLGYPEAGKNSLLKKTKSYMSCAIGRIQGEEEKEPSK